MESIYLAIMVGTALIIAAAFSSLIAFPGSALAGVTPSAAWCHGSERVTIKLVHALILIFLILYSPSVVGRDALHSERG